jgi:hypothetical protein
MAKKSNNIPAKTTQLRVITTTATGVCKVMKLRQLEPHLTGQQGSLGACGCVREQERH